MSSHDQQPVGVLQAFVPALDTVTVRQVAPPEPAPDEVVVRMLLTGICGSDTHAIAGHHPLLKPPYVPGHEAIGLVETCGTQVSGLQTGQRVVLKPNVVCGHCVNCLAGRSNACVELAWIGCDPSGQHPGAMADLFLAPARNLHPVPEGISDHQAALVECLATPVHAVRIAGDLTDVTVVILGGGTIGVLTLLAARKAGARAVVITDLDPVKRERAVRLGAAAGLDAADPALPAQVTEALGGRADVLFDCVAAEGSARQWTALVRRAATVVLVGVPARDYVVPTVQLQDWELRLQGSASYTEADFETALSLGGEIPAEEIVTDVLDLTEAASAFSRAIAPGVGKVLVSARS
ncbi:zinc-binding dehydrogenase [Naumannella halotolerans]|uniref:zinc-dependent alcohol dehydrogenase n=1 Tax=Naumannella halotolerans TaxID=993414 RepID=UPI00370D3B7E